jgi:hypothetical protein
MARERKTIDTFRLMVTYPGPHGWEHELTEYTREAARDRLREYRENCPQYPARIVTRREPRAGFTPAELEAIDREKAEAVQARITRNLARLRDAKPTA